MKKHQSCQQTRERGRAVVLRVAAAAAAPAASKSKLWLALLLLACCKLQLVACLFEHQLPAPFDETRLPGRASQSLVANEFIENLGSIIKLDSPYLLPPRSGSISAKFGVHNRRKSTDDIIFEPQQVCFASACYGPYQFNLDQLASSGFNASLQTVILVSGFLTKDRVSWMEQSKDLLLQLDDVNVIVVTWKDLNRYIYQTAVANTPLVARQITIMLHYLAAFNGAQLSDLQFTKRIHFVGHSLGAHIGGFVGQDLDGRLGRITGLDPAGPSFELVSAKQKLDPTDALLVDVIHTNAGRMRYFNLLTNAAYDATSKLWERLPGFGRANSRQASTGSRLSFGRSIPLGSGAGAGATSSISGDEAAAAASSEADIDAEAAWYGLDDQVGHIDYYANGGRVQPGCLGVMHTCDHKRSHDIYLAILKHELQLRGYSLSSQRLGQDRLLAFSSQDYESFLDGYSFAQKCPSLLSTADSIGSSSSSAQNIDGASTTASAKPTRTNSANQFNHCTVPIDMLTPIDQLRDELSTRHGFNFNLSPQAKKLIANQSSASAATGVESRKFYFRTHFEMPLVGDHSLIKIRLVGPRRASDEPAGVSKPRDSAGHTQQQPVLFGNNWAPSCALWLELQFGYGLTIKLELNKANAPIHLIDSGQFYGLVAPFVSPHGAAARDALNRVLVSSMLQQGPQLIETIWEPLIKVLPVEIALGVVDNSATPSGLMEKMKEKLYSLFGSRSRSRESAEDSGALQQRCRLQVSSIEVQPLVNYGRTFVGLYGLHSVPLLLGADEANQAAASKSPASASPKQATSSSGGGGGSSSSALRPSIFVVNSGQQVSLLHNLRGNVGQLSLQNPDLFVKLDALAIE